MSTEQAEIHEVTIEIPAKVKVFEHHRILGVEGPLGKTRKSFKKIPIDIHVDEKSIMLKSQGTRKRDYAIFKTAESLVNTMIKGVQTGYTFKMKIVYAHFPITVKVKDGSVHVENFQGERAARVSKIFGSTKVASKGDDVIITGPVLTDVSQTCASLQQNTKVKNKDSRVFLDGIYLFEKQDGIEK